MSDLPPLEVRERIERFCADLCKQGRIFVDPAFPDAKDGQAHKIVALLDANGFEVETLGEFDDGFAVCQANGAAPVVARISDMRPR